MAENIISQTHSLVGCHFEEIAGAGAGADAGVGAFTSRPGRAGSEESKTTGCTGGTSVS